MEISSDVQQKIADVQREFDEDAKQAAAVSTSTLLKILEHNKDTEYGKKYGFGTITNIKQFKQINPLTTYEDYQQFVKRMIEGEENLLTSNRVTFFAKSSGTTGMGHQKIIPYTNYRSPFRWDLLKQGASYQAFPATVDSNLGILVLNMYGGEYKTKSGVSVGVASTSLLPEEMKIKPFPYTSPPDVFSLTDVTSAKYLHALYALKTPNPLFLQTSFITHMLDFLKFIERHWQEIVQDIRLGTINNNCLTLEPEVKQSLLQKLQPDPERADELVQISKQGFKDIALRIWPNLQYARCLAGGSFSIYIQECKFYLGRVPIYSAAHGASEGLIGLNLWPGKHIARFVPVPQRKYIEFIPVAEINHTNPSTRELNELKVGESYEVVITKFAGLYRYRLGDIIKVVDHYHELPIYELEGRASTLLDITAERTTEEIASIAISEAVCRQSHTLVDFTTLIDMEKSPPSYRFFVELGQSSDLPAISTSELEARLSQELDQQLKTANAMYEHHRNGGAIGEARVSLVKKNTFIAAAALLVKRGASEFQVKIPRYTRREDLIKLLKNNCLSS